MALFKCLSRSFNSFVYFESDSAIIVWDRSDLIDLTHDVMEHRKYRIKVPSGICSRKEDVESPVVFKNMTDDTVSLYWIDYNGKARFYADLGPVFRNNVGFRITTFQTHPWVAVQHGTQQLLMNGKKYFLPPNPNGWKSEQLGWLQNLWLLPPSTKECEFETGKQSQKDEEFYEVIIKQPGCMTLHNLCLLRCCELYPTKKSATNLQIPNKLLVQMEHVRQRYFYQL